MPKVPTTKQSRSGDVLFEVVIKHVVGTVVDQPGGKHPVAAGFEIAAEGIAKGHERVEFTFEGTTYAATMEPAHPAMSEDEMKSALLAAGYDVYRIS